MTPEPMRPAVSVLIVNYRAYRELDDCLASLDADAAAGFVQAVVVDNSSDPERVAAVRERHPHATVLTNVHNAGFAAGVNQAARTASGKYFLLLNPDAVVRPGAIRAMADYLQSHGQCAVVGARVLDNDGTLQRSARSFPTPLTGLFGRTSAITRLWPNNPWTRANLLADDATTTPLEVDWVAGSCMMVRASVFRDIGGMDEGFFLYWEDADFCRRVHAQGSTCVYVPDAVAVHQVGRSSRQASTRSIFAFHRSALRFYWKHGGLIARAFAPIAAAALAARAAMLIATRGDRPPGATGPAPDRPD